LPWRFAHFYFDFVKGGRVLFCEHIGRESTTRLDWAKNSGGEKKGQRTNLD